MDYNDFDYDKHPYGYHKKDNWCPLMHNIVATIVTVAACASMFFLPLNLKVVIFIILGLALYILKKE